MKGSKSMPFDLNILVVKQSNKTNPPFSSAITILNEIDDSDGKRYHSIFPFMTQTEGIWYSLVKEDDGVVYASFCYSNFDQKESEKTQPYWVIEDNVKSGLTPLLIKKEFEEEFKKIITFLMDQSPIKTIMLLPRYQGSDEEVICGVLSLDDFWLLLNEQKILFNTSYIIRTE
jgi:hypothetical protein